MGAQNFRFFSKIVQKCYLSRPLVQDASWKPPRACQEPPGSLPRAVPEPSRGTQEHPRAVSEAPKRRPRATKHLSKCNSTVNNATFQKPWFYYRKIKVFAGLEHSRTPARRAKWSQSGACRPAWRAKWSPSGAWRSV